MAGSPQFRLQIGMCSDFGKPQGTVARVCIGKLITSIHTKLQNKKHAIEALYRASLVSQLVKNPPAMWETWV